MELTRKELKIKEIAELFLQEIFNEYQVDKGHSFIDMTEIAKKIGLKEYDSRIIDATTLLEEAGYIDCNTMADGISIVKLTAKGILHLEETNDFRIKNVGMMSGDTIINYINNPSKSQININSSNSTQNINENEVEKILTSLERIINEHESFRTEERRDYLTDLRIMREELTKSKPDKGFLKGKLDTLAKFAPLATLVNSLISIIA